MPDLFASTSFQCTVKCRSFTVVETVTFSSGEIASLPIASDVPSIAVGTVHTLTDDIHLDQAADDYIAQTQARVRDEGGRAHGPGVGSTVRCPHCHRDIPAAEYTEHLKYETQSARHGQLKRDAAAKAVNIARAEVAGVGSGRGDLAADRPDLTAATAEEELAAEKARAARRGAQVGATWDGHKASAQALLTRVVGSTEMAAVEGEALPFAAGATRVIGTTLEGKRPVGVDVVHVDFGASRGGVQDVSVTELTVAGLKAAVHALLNIPPNKQKYRLGGEGPFLADAIELEPGAGLTFSMKERGGGRRKKK